MTPPTTTPTLTIATDRTLVRSRWHSKRHIVARLTAPVAPTGRERPPVNLAFVLDRSGSMDGAKLRLAAKAVEEGIGRLRASDRFSVGMYDSEIDVLVPGTFASGDSRRDAVERLARVTARGSTDLCGGWLAGCEQVATALIEDGVNRALLLTDGLANVGMTAAHELAHHATQLRARGVSTSTFGVGNDFDEVLLQSMAQAGGGHFYDIASAAAIGDHIGSEVGDTLEVVARDVSLQIVLPEGVRVESLGAFTARAAHGRTVIDIGDLVSGQEVEVPLRLSFPLGRIGEVVAAVMTVADRGDVLADAIDRASWEYADDSANDAQPRDVEADRIIARVFAARARREAVHRNKTGDYAAARRVLEATARRIGAYAGRDPELHSIADDLRREIESFQQAMPERQRKEAYASSAYALQSRAFDGTARKRS